MTSLRLDSPMRPEERFAHDLRIHFAHQELTPAHRRVAQFIAGHPEQVAIMTSGQLAKVTSVSQPTVTRCALALGFSGWVSLRAELRRAIAEPQSTLGGNIFQHAVRSEISNLEALDEFLSESSIITNFGVALASSRPLLVLGLRSSAGVADHFAWLLAALHPDVRKITRESDSGYDTILQASEGGGTWIVAFLLSRRPRLAVSLLEYAKSRGLKVGIVTNHTDTLIEKYADVVIPTVIDSELVMDSHAAAVVLCAVLTQAVADAMPEPVQARLEAF
ncbi:MAG: MurR/RpiR family transcriptional regulator [Sulfobacillus sp.]